MDIYRTKETYEKEKAWIAEFPTSDENKRLIFDFLRRMEVEGRSYVQLVKYTCTIRGFLKRYKGELMQAKSHDIEDYLLSMRELAEKTRSVRFYSLRVFFKFIKMGRAFNGIKITERWRHKLPDSILTEDEVEKIIAQGGKHSRFFAVAYESGCRIGELLTALQENVSFDENGATIQIFGKTGSRRIRIIQYAEYMKFFLDGGKILFPFTYDAVRMMMLRAARRAGIQKKVHLHLFRHSRATHLASHLTEPEMRIFFGWSRGSIMPATYVHLSGRDVDSKLVRLNESQDRSYLSDAEFLKFAASEWQKQKWQSKLSAFTHNIVH